MHGIVIGALMKKLKPRMKTNALIFEKKGNPWVSQKEGEKLFGRNLETENPDLDCFLFAKKRQKDTRPEIAGIPIVKAKKKEVRTADASRKIGLLSYKLKKNYPSIRKGGKK